MVKIASREYVKPDLQSMCLIMVNYIYNKDYFSSHWFSFAGWIIDKFDIF